MGQFDKLLIKIMSGCNDHNIKFIDLIKVLKTFGFNERIKGGHHIFYKDDIEEILNLQPLGSKSKPYQVKQVRQLIVKYKIGGNYDD